MNARHRIDRYRKTGAGAGLMRVEVLVPPSARQDILSHAAAIRESYRSDIRSQGRAQALDDLKAKVAKALERYGIRVLDNIDLSRIPDPGDQARVVAKALMERGDARAFVLGRQILDQSSLIRNDA